MNDAVRTAFRTFDLPEHASEAEAKDAYRTLVAVWHPDRFMNQPHLRVRAEQKVKQINLAFDLLSKHFRQASDPQWTDRLPSGPPPSDSGAHRTAPASMSQERDRKA